MCALSSHRCVCPPEPLSQYLKSSIMGYLDWQLSLYWEVSLYQSRLLLLHMSGHMAGVTLCPVHPHIRVPLPARGLLCSGDSCPKFPPLSPLTYPLIDIIFHPPPLPGLRVWVTQNSRPIFTQHWLSPLLSLSLDCASLISPLQISLWPLVPACKV